MSSVLTWTFWGFLFQIQLLSSKPSSNPTLRESIGAKALLSIHTLDCLFRPRFSEFHLTSPLEFFLRSERSIFQEGRRQSLSKRFYGAISEWIRVWKRNGTSQVLTCCAKVIGWGKKVLLSELFQTTILEHDLGCAYANNNRQLYPSISLSTLDSAVI